MKIHEYQAKELFRQFNIPTDSGVLVSDKNAELYIPFLPPYVIKAQVHSGGRGKAGGVKLAKSIAEAKEIVNKMIGSTLYTKQVPDGKVVNQVLITDASALTKQMYLALKYSPLQLHPFQFLFHGK